MMIVGSVLEVVVSGKPVVVVVSKGYTLVEPSSKSMNCLFINLYNTNADTPRARMVPKTRRIVRSLGSIVFGVSSDTCPSLTSFTGWRKKTILASFPFISDTEPKKALHLQLVKVCVRNNGVSMKLYNITSQCLSLLQSTVSSAELTVTALGEMTNGGGGSEVLSKMLLL